LPSDLLQQWQLALITAELVFLVAQGVGVAGRPGVFQVAAEGGISQAHAAVELVVFQLGQYAQALGVALEAEKVGTFCLAQVIQPAALQGLAKPVANGILAGMPEGWVANIMGQAGRLHDNAQVGGTAPLWQGVTQAFADPHAQRAADAADLQGVGQTRMDMVIAGHRMDLGLTSQAAKGTGEDHPVMVLVKWAAPQLFGALRGLTQALAAQQAVPVQKQSSSQVVRRLACQGL